MNRSLMEAQETGQTQRGTVAPKWGRGFLGSDWQFSILGEFWSWEHPQPTSKGRNLSEANDMAAQMTTKSLLK